jgi:hypothetical protein
LWHKLFPADNLLPFVMIDTWNDHEEGTAIEDGIPTCNPGAQEQTAASAAAATAAEQKKP